MGNRAIVVFKNGSEVSPRVYLHWGGSQVPQVLARWWELMEGRRGDESYGAARFIGLCHETFSGNMSLGVFSGERELNSCDWNDESPGDAGVFLVDTNTGEVERFDGSPHECDAPPTFRCQDYQEQTQTGEA